MNKGKLVKEYFSGHYEHVMPKTKEGWQWAVDRIGLNFGGAFEALPRESPILDIPCGVGFLEHYLLRKGFTKIHAIDISEEQIQVAKDKLQEYELDYNNKIEFQIVDAFEYLNENKNTYAAIAIIDFLEHLKKDEVINILDLAKSALIHGGLLFTRVINADNPMWGKFFYHDFTHETPFTPDSLRQCLSTTGFDTIKIDYEVIPKMHKRDLALSFKQFIKREGRWALAKFFEVSPNAFTEDLIAVARKE